jgi:hypothetical protein
MFAIDPHRGRRSDLGVAMLHGVVVGGRVVDGRIAAAARVVCDGKRGRYIPRPFEGLT